MSEEEIEQSPHDCVREAVKYLQTKVILDEEVRNEFIVRLQIFVDFCIERTLRACQVFLSSHDREDVGSEVNAYLLEKWFPRVKAHRRASAVGAYLTATVSGIVRNFVEEMFQRLTREAFDSDFTGEPLFVRETDFRLDRAQLQDEIRRRAEEYLRVRPRRAVEVREVVERMIRVLLWRRYTDSGGFAGAPRWDPAHSTPGVVSV